ncbi:serine/threonine protein kinase [Streptomyces sp. NBC_00829]|uniref:serine/threonine protein kinase n=1 Tax=Streptomyces sp. NBC_00829 TaxID=2903679 RepID=UPI00386F1A38|nr:serine/threonine protein kinase [Streptomyces sp. NBC_00829]
MTTVIVQLPEPAGRHPDDPRTKPRLLHLSPGQRAEFGRGTPASLIPIRLDDPGVSRCAGEVAAAEDYWRLSNYSPHSTYVVENLEGAGEHIRVAPGRIGAPVPFELSRVVLPAAEGAAEFKVFAPQHAYKDAGCSPSAGEPTAAPFSLDPTSKYFLVLLALCEPRLRSSPSTAVPGVGEVLERLKPLPACADLTRSAVNYHIDYLASAKLRLREDAGGSTARGGKRGEIIALALRFNLVREEHLSLLPPPVRR